MVMKTTAYLARDSYALLSSRIVLALCCCLFPADCFSQQTIDEVLAAEDLGFELETEDPDFDEPVVDSARPKNPQFVEDAVANQESQKTADLWWQDELRDRVFDEGTPFIRIGLNELILSALSNSRRIKIAKIDRFVEQEQITQADANFDWNFFANHLFNNTDQQTGSELDGGAGLARLIQQQFDKDVGLRKQNYYGGNVQLTQNLRLLDSNSQFVDPNDQGFTQLTLRFNQPLLRDGGLVVNYGQVILARLNAQAVSADSQTAIIDIVSQVVNAYWNIYRVRSTYLVQKRLVEKIQELLDDVTKRSKIDARKSLIGQAESELATQLSILAAIKTQLIQAQLQLVRIVGDRDLGQFTELVPVTDTPAFEMPLDRTAAFSTAMQYRPELRAAANRIKGSELNNDINLRNLLPGLAFILETNVNGVNGDFDIARSFGDQFSKGGPSYSVGLNYEVPIGNRAARSRVRESQLRIAREVANFEDTVDQIRLDVDVAVNGLTGSRDQYQIRVESFQKAVQVVESLVKRRNIFPEQLDQVSQLYVREILDAQQRAAAAANAIINLLFDYSIANIQLRQAMGTLLSSYDEFNYDEYIEDPDPRAYKKFGKRKQKQAVQRAIVDDVYQNSEYSSDASPSVPSQQSSVAPTKASVQSDFFYPNQPAPNATPNDAQPQPKSSPVPTNDSPRYPLPEISPLEAPVDTKPEGTSTKYPLDSYHLPADEIVRITKQN